MDAYRHDDPDRYSQRKIHHALESYIDKRKKNS